MVTSDKVILRFYFDFNDTAKQGLDGMLRSFVLQLHNASHSTKAYMSGLFRTHQNGRDQPSIEALSTSVCDMLASHEAVVVIIDALDESSTRLEVVQWLRNVVTCPELSHVRLFCTGRPEVEFIDMLPRILGAQNCLAIDEHAVNADIRAFVAAQLQGRE